MRAQPGQTQNSDHAQEMNSTLWQNPQIVPYKFLDKPIWPINSLTSITNSAQETRFQMLNSSKQRSCLKIARILRKKTHTLIFLLSY